MTRVLVVDGHPAKRFGLTSLLRGENGVRVVGECAEARDALRLAERLQPDLVILGLNLVDEVDGLRACLGLKGLPEPPRVLAYSAYNLPDDVASYLWGWADSYLHKRTGCKELVDAVTLTASGRRIWMPSVRINDTESSLRAVSEGDLLTCREREVLALLVRRLSDVEVARELRVSLPTAKTHVRSVLRKLRRSSRRDLIQE